MDILSLAKIAATKRELIGLPDEIQSVLEAAPENYVKVAEIDSWLKDNKDMFVLLDQEKINRFFSGIGYYYEEEIFNIFNKETQKNQNVIVKVPVIIIAFNELIDNSKTRELSYCTRIYTQYKYMKNKTFKRRTVYEYASTDPFPQTNVHFVDFEGQNWEEVKQDNLLKWKQF